MPSPWKDNAAAQAALQRMGRPAGPPQGAAYRYRVARSEQRARSQGVRLTRSQIRGHAGTGQRRIGDVLERQRPTTTARGVRQRLARQVRQRKVVRTPGGTIVSPSASDRTRKREIRRAAREGKKVSALVRVRMPDGSYRTRWVTGQTYSYGLGEGEVIDVQLVIGDTGLDADQWADGDIDAALEELADEGAF